MSHHFESTWSGHKQKGAQQRTKRNFSPLSGQRGPLLLPQRAEGETQPPLIAGSYAQFIDFSKCWLMSAASVSAVRHHFLLIVMRLDYLSTQVITVHLLSPLPVSDHRGPSSTQVALFSAYRWGWTVPGAHIYGKRAHNMTALLKVSPVSVSS